MVRSLKFIGAMLSMAASTSTAFAPQHARFSFSNGVTSESHNAPITALSAAFVRDDVVMMPATAT